MYLEYFLPFHANRLDSSDTSFCIRPTLLRVVEKRQYRPYIEARIFASSQPLMARTRTLPGIGSHYPSAFPMPACPHWWCTHHRLNIHNGTMAHIRICYYIWIKCIFRLHLLVSIQRRHRLLGIHGLAKSATGSMQIRICTLPPLWCVHGYCSPHHWITI